MRTIEILRTQSSRTSVLHKSTTSMSLLTEIYDIDEGLVMEGQVLKWTEFAARNTFNVALPRVLDLMDQIGTKSALAMTAASLPSITATQLLVVPRSIPMILLMMFSSNLFVDIVYFIL